MTEPAKPAGTTASAKPPENAFERLILDLGPLIVYFIAFRFFDIFVATGAFMAATAIAMLVSLIRTGKVSVIQSFSAIMVLLLGGLTILLHKEWIIKIKPTIYYVTLAAILLWGYATGRPTLRALFGATYPGLTERGWMLLTRNWGLFFVLLAIANEAVWRTQTTDFWLGYKLWGSLPATVVFAACNIPMLLRNGMAQDVELAEEIPPQG